MKKLLAMILVVTMCLSLCIPTFAMEKTGPSEPDFLSVKSFIDGEGKLNTVYVSSSEPGSAHVDYYIDGILINSVDANLLASHASGKTALCDSSQVQITYTDRIANNTTTYSNSLSQFITTDDLEMPYQTNAHGTKAAAYIYQGRINYYPYDDMGTEYRDKLSVYLQTGTTTNEYKTINTAAGTAASVAISVLAAALTLFSPVLASLASNLFYAAVSAAGVTIVGGIIQGAITKTYYVRTTKYNVKARDESVPRERIYEAERYKVALNGGGYSSNYYYEGPLPWNTNNAARWMFGDFWYYSYPGVESFS